MKPETTSTPPPQPGLWSALREAVPELNQPPAMGYIPVGLGAGQRAWLITQFALNTNARSITRQLDQIIEEQVVDGVQQWMPLTVHTVETWRGSLEHEWKPASLRLAERIETVGVLGKNQRLLSLLQVAEELATRMFEEQDKQLRKYLISEYRATLRQIAEEKGELGEPASESNDAWMALASMFGKALNIQGSRPLAKQEEQEHDDGTDRDSLRI